MITVIDTSVAIKWFINESGEQTDKAKNVLLQIKLDPTRFVVPELFFNEILAVFCKIISDAKTINHYLEILSQLGIERIGNGRQLLSEATIIAKKYSLPGYDAIFVSTAKLVSGVWLTADKDAVKKLRVSGIAELL